MSMYRKHINEHDEFYRTIIASPQMQERYEDIAWILYDNYYDGPLSGLVKSDRWGTVYADLIDEPFFDPCPTPNMPEDYNADDPYRRERSFILIYPTPVQLNLILCRNKLFEIMVQGNPGDSPACKDFYAWTQRNPMPDQEVNSSQIAGWFKE